MQGLQIKKSWRRLHVYDAIIVDQNLLDIISHPEKIFAQSDKIILKAGRSATVIQFAIGNQQYILKRYNLKNFWHRLRRALRRTRAHDVFFLSRYLQTQQINTAKPIAFVENRFFNFRGVSFLMTEYVSDVHIAEHLKLIEEETAKKQIVKKILTELQQLSQLKVTHGDLKATNILLNQNQEPVLIDLDGAKQHKFNFRFKHHFKKDIQRFIKNFEHDLSIKNLILACINKEWL